MELEFWIGAFIVTLGLFLSSEQQNGYQHLEEDIYLPQYYKKSGKIFKKIFKQEYLRFRVYWIQKITLLNFVIYTIILFVGYVMRVKFDFTYSYNYKLFLVIYFLVWATLRLPIDFLVWIYVQYQKNKR